VRVLGTVVHGAMVAGLHPRQPLPLGCALTRPLIRDDAARDVQQAYAERAEERLGRLLVPPALYEAIAHVRVLIDGPPQGGALFMNGDAHLVPVPCVARSGAPPTALSRILLAACATPVLDGFVRDESSAEE
jgi:hypothetical protein